ncbi:MAG: indolepyruvate ferredoxin oxidoreductase subunit alpha [Syntrophomonadaceae bacterium]|nr:indolepyruvate ferredoxin oxidoreductase subunit alpha [Syntrophomonadaceae bacterium]
MKKLMIGNAAIARGAYEAGATVGTAYPGTPSTEIVSSFAQFDNVYAEWAPNEKVALEVGIGASIAGARTLVAMKHVGVNVAADPLYSFSYTGVNGGLVLVSADDPGMHSSQNEQDNRGHARFAKLPVLEPSDSQEALDFTRLGFELSEQFDRPVMLRITTRLAHSQTLVTEGEPQPYELKEYKKDAPKYVMLPAFGRLRHVEIENRMVELKEYVETSPLNRIEYDDLSLGVITSGVVYQYVKEALPHASVLKLGITNPLPRKMIEEFAAKVERLVIVEELEPVFEEQIRSWGIKAEGKELFTLLGEYSSEYLAEKLGGQAPAPGFGLNDQVPARPPLLCAGCPHRGVFHTLRRMRLVVAGDIGCYTLGALAPAEGIDSCICMGASIGTALGMEKARGEEFAQKTVAVIGDSTFVHSGITPLIDVVYNQGRTTVMILDNDTTAMTGHQDHPATGLTIRRQPTRKLDLKDLVRAIGIEQVRVVDPLDLTALRDTLQEELARPEPSVIICKRACALIDKERKPYRLTVDADLCNGCKACIRLGCTGIVFDDDNKKAYTHSSCVACGLCEQVCKVDAVKRVEG